MIVIRKVESEMIAIILIRAFEWIRLHGINEHMERSSSEIAIKNISFV